MSEEAISLPVPGPAELHIATSSGRVTVIAEERDDVLIERGAPSRRRVEADPTGKISFKSARGGSTNVVARVPDGSDVVVGTISGAVELTGAMGAVRVTSVSSAVSVQQAEALDVRTVSGTIEVGESSGTCSLRTKSGRTVCGTVENASVSTISGRIELNQTRGKVRVQSVSGRIAVGTQEQGDVAVQTMSGRVLVEVPQGVRPRTKLVSVTGRPKTALEQGDDCSIAVRTLSGKIEVVSR